MLLQNIFFFLGVIGMMCVLIAGTIGIPMSDLPLWAKIILEIILVWCDLIGIGAIVNRIHSIKIERAEEKKLKDKENK